MAAIEDQRFMAQAIRLAERGLLTTDPNPRVGCVLVKNGQIVGEGWHERAGEPHAEVHALRMAGEEARDATAYLTLEPCSHHGRTGPCSDALVAAGVARVVAAMQDPNPKVAGQGFEKLRAAGIAVEVGLMQAQAETLNPGFIQRMRQGRPWVRCKLAMSLDGRTAMASGESQWITSAAARADVHRLRARSSAIVTGINTVLADDASLNARLAGEGEVLQPLRVVLDSQLQMPPTARMLTIPGKTLVLTCQENSAAIAKLRAAGAEVAVITPRQDRLDLSAVMSYLGQQEINEVLVEAGPTLSGAMLQAGLIDELFIYMAPALLGHKARGLMTLPGLESMHDKIELQIVDIRAVGCDWRIKAYPRHKL